MNIYARAYIILQIFVILAGKSYGMQPGSDGGESVVSGNYRIMAGQFMHSYLRDNDISLYYYNLNYKRSGIFGTAEFDRMTITATSELGVSTLSPEKFYIGLYAKAGPQLRIHNFNFDVNAGGALIMVGSHGTRSEILVGFNGGFFVNVSRWLRTEIESGVHHVFLRSSTTIPYVAVGFSFR